MGVFAWALAARIVADDRRIRRTSGRGTLPPPNDSPQDGGAGRMQGSWDSPLDAGARACRAPRPPRQRRATSRSALRARGVRCGRMIPACSQSLRRSWSSSTRSPLRAPPRPTTSSFPFRSASNAEPPERSFALDASHRCASVEDCSPDGRRSLRWRRHRPRRLRPPLTAPRRQRARHTRGARGFAS